MAIIQLASDLIRTFNLQNVQVLKAPVNEYQISQVTTQDIEYYKSKLGTPVLVDVYFPGGSYTDNDGNIQYFDEVRLETVLVTINQTKNIVKTPVQGRNGTIKEYIAMGDYSVSINGIITGPNGHYPVEDVIPLKNILTAPIALKVVSWYLQLWDIDLIVIDDFDIAQEEGGYSYQPFTITASSDQDIDLRLN